MKILILHASAGEGHRRAALAVESALIRSGVDAKDIKTHDTLDYGGEFFKNSYNGFYFNCVKYAAPLWGFFYYLLDNALVYKMIYPFRRLYNAWHGRNLLNEVLEKKPQLIICTHFLSAELLGHAKKHGRIASKILVVVTDYHPVRVWQHDGIDRYWVLSEEAKQTLIARGVAAEKITAGGFPIASEFTRSAPRSEILKKYGLEEGRITLLITTGSFGLGEQEKILSLIESDQSKIQCFVVCGRNQALEKALSSKKYPYPAKIFGFVNFMADLMDAADLMVAKPGGATTAEALTKRVPMIATGAIPGQETENLKFLLSQNAVFSASSPEEIAAIVRNVIANPRLLTEKREAADRLAHPTAADDIAQLRREWF